MAVHDFTWTQRSALPLAASVIVGSWAVVAGLVAAIAHLFGGEAVVVPAYAIAGILAGVVVLLLTVAAFLGCVLERPAHTKPLRSELSISRRAA